MRPKESVIENYLCRRVKDHGGEVRKVVWLGRRGAPDRLVMLKGKHPLVEVKRPGETPRPEQLREHAKLRRAGFEVHWLDTKEAVDTFVAALIQEKTNA